MKPLVAATLAALIGFAALSAYAAPLFSGTDIQSSDEDKDKDKDKEKKGD